MRHLDWQFELNADTAGLRNTHDFGHFDDLSKKKNSSQSPLVQLEPKTVQVQLTTLAASSKLSQAMIFNGLEAILILASSTLVPCRRTTIGTVNFKLLAASIIPSAMMSHLMMPPKMFTKIACTYRKRRDRKLLSEF